MRGESGRRGLKEAGNMRAVDFQASVNNLTVMDRHQQEMHKTPIVNQQQNIEKARDEAAQRVDKPVQPDQVEGKKVDPNDKRKEGRGREKKQRKQQDAQQQNRPSPSRDSGLFVDLDA
jgi:hypothetical protein